MIHTRPAAPSTEDQGPRITSRAAAPSTEHQGPRITYLHRRSEAIL